VISGSRRLVNEVVALHGCYVASIGGCLRFGTTSESTLQRSGSFLGQTDILIFINPLSKSQICLFPRDMSDVHRDSSVGIATRYGLDGPGFESR